MLLISLDLKFFQRIKISLQRKQQKLFDIVLFNWLLYIKGRLIQPNQNSAMIFAPHQDDETFGCGGVIALKRKQEIPVSVVFLTDGRASHRSHPSLKPSELTKIRYQEAIKALDILGVKLSDIHFLNQPDSQLTQLSKEHRQQLIQKLVELLQNKCPQEVYVPYRQDANSDHEATYQLVREAIVYSKISIELIQYPIWCLWHPQKLDFKSPELSNVYRVPIKNVLQQKKQAMAVYKSQYLPLNNYNQTPLPSGFLKRFSSNYEIFFKI